MIKQITTKTNQRQIQEFSTWGVQTLLKKKNAAVAAPTHRHPVSAKVGGGRQGILMHGNSIMMQLLLYYIGLFQKIDAHPPKEDMGIPKMLTTFFIGKSQKIKHFFGCKGKEDTGIPKIFSHF